MSETAILIPVVAALFAISLALVGVVWATLKERLKAAEDKVGALDQQNTQQETSIGRLTERMIAREEAHSQHREDMAGRLDRIEGKLDKLLAPSPRTPYPTRYGQGNEPERGR